MNMLDRPRSIDHQALYECLMDHARGSENDVFIAQMLSSQLSSKSAMPGFLGLTAEDFEHLLMRHFAGFCAPHTYGTAAPAAWMRQDRASELEDVRALLLAHRANRSSSEIWIARIIAIGSLAPDHLWSDLGLFSRTHLTRMMDHNFPALAAGNDNNMKWKKFLYKQLCAQEGIYVCRAPSCEACADYAACFIDPLPEAE